MVDANKDDSEACGVEPYSVLLPDSTKKYLVFLSVSLTLSTLTATIYFPWIPVLSVEFSVPIQRANPTVTVYVVCQDDFPALFTSLVDPYGRLLALTGIYACESLGLALNRESYRALMAIRALPSIGGSPAPAIAYGIIAEAADLGGARQCHRPHACNLQWDFGCWFLIGGIVAFSTGGFV